MADVLNVFWLMLLKGFWQLAEILWQFVNELPVYLNSLCPFNYLYILPFHNLLKQSLFNALALQNMKLKQMRQI